MYVCMYVYIYTCIYCSWKPKKPYRNLWKHINSYYGNHELSPIDENHRWNLMEI